MPVKRNYFEARPILLTLTIVIAIALLNGCASVKIAQYQHNKVNGNYSQVKDDLSVSINPIIDAVESKKYFGRDILSSGVLAVHILIENLSSSDDYIFEKDKIVFKEGGGLGNQGHKGVGEEIRANEQSAIDTQAVGLGATFLVTPLALPLYFAGLSNMRNLNAVKHNMISKELRTKIVHHGEKIQGFVYFSIKSDVIKTNSNRIDVPFMKMGKSKLGIFQFDF